MNLFNLWLKFLEAKAKYTKVHRFNYFQDLQRTPYRNRSASLRGYYKVTILKKNYGIYGIRYILTNFDYARFDKNRIATNNFIVWYYLKTALLKNLIIFHQHTLVNN